MIKKLVVCISLLTFTQSEQAIPNPAIIKREQLQSTMEKILQFRLCRCHKKSPIQIQEFLKEVDAWKDAFEESRPFLIGSDVEFLAEALSSHATAPYTAKTQAKFKQARKVLSAHINALKQQAEKDYNERILGSVSGIHEELLIEYALPVLKAFEHLKPFKEKR